MSEPITYLQGDCRTVLKELPAESVQCVVTSPPYWGLRDYKHKDQIGQEKTPEAYVETMRQVFAEVRRVLHKTGTLWVVIGDSYTSGGRKTRDPGQMSKKHPAYEDWNAGRAPTPPGLKPKDLIGIPWVVAFALRADGWYLRQDIIWHKPSCMPESVEDRCTRAHEFIFMFTKAAKYYYDHEAIKEPSEYPDDDRKGRSYDHHKSAPTEERNGIRPRSWKGSDFHDGRNAQNHPNVGTNRPMNYLDEGRGSYAMRNKRSVWSVTNAGYAEAHFATFPPDLIKPCILAGTKAGDVVLDPFAGSGTTGMVAIEFGRRAILIELNPEYVDLAKKRCFVTPGLPL